MADWEEVRKLAADFQKVQQSSAKQRLSERNVIELVTKLVKLHLIEVLYTSDGKTYLTQQQLGKEIKDELVVHGGRVNLVDLQQLLNVDYSHIEAKVNDLIKKDSHLTLVLGQLINNTYRDRLAQEINDLLQEKGHVTIVGLTQTHDLPADFLREVIDTNLGKKIKGQIDNYDKDVIFTEAFVARMRAQIRGAFSAITVPTTIGPIRQAIGCQEHLFHTILEGLISSKRLAGSLSGTRQDKSQFLPEIYTRAQTEWVDSFYKQNGYLEYDAVARLGISDPKSYIKKRFKSDSSIVYLSSCCVGSSIYEQVQYSIDEALNTGTWVDIKTVLPSVLSGKDASELLSNCVKGRDTALICGSTIVGSNKLVTNSTEAFMSLMTQRAEVASKAQPASLANEGKTAGSDKSSHSKVVGIDDGSSAREDKKDQRRKKAAAAGSTKKEGTGGREVKIKSTKKKGGGGRGRDAGDDGSDEEGVAQSGGGGGGKGRMQQEKELKFLSIAEIEEVLVKESHLQDCPPQLISEIASKLHRPLTRQYQEVAKSIFLKGAGGLERKKTAQEIQDKINGLWTNIHLFEKGIKMFEESTQGLLAKHLLKTVCSDLANTAVLALAHDNMVNLPSDQEDQLTQEARLRLIGNLPRNVQEPLSRLHSSLTGSSLEDFLHQAEVVCGPAHLGILLRKADKKKERQLVFNHRQSLAEQLRAEKDPAMTLHLATVLLFQTQTQCMLHCPGRLVPAVLTHLGTIMEPDTLTELTKMQDLVVQQMKLKADPANTDEEEAQLKTQLDDIIEKVKTVALTTKKGATNQEDH